MVGTRRYARGGGAEPEPSIEFTVKQLVEAWHRREATQAELERFHQSQERPTPPEEFANVSQLVEYHNRVRDYEAALDVRSRAIDSALSSYKDAAEFLREVMPEDVPLTYDYPDLKEPMLGKRYTIINRQGEVFISAIEQR